MAFIETVAEDSAVGPTAELFDRLRASHGYVPNYAALFACRPEVFEAWSRLIGAIRANMDLRRYELATLAAARALRSSYCSLAHGAVLRREFLDDEQLRAAADGQVDSRVEQAVMALAAKVGNDATSVTAADVGLLRELGLEEVEIFDVVLTAAARAFFAKTLDALAALPDRELGIELGPELSAKLAVGRPIED